MQATKSRSSQGLHLQSVGHPPKARCAPLLEQHLSVLGYTPAAPLFWLWGVALSMLEALGALERVVMTARWRFGSRDLEQ